jgi:hypothetical protein
MARENRGIERGSMYEVEVNVYRLLFVTLLHFWKVFHDLSSMFKRLA